MKITPKAIAALRLLENCRSSRNGLSAKALARLLWPDELKACGTSLRRGGYYRSAGAIYSRLQREGLVGNWIDDFGSVYYLKDEGAKVLSTHQP